MQEIVERSAGHMLAPNLMATLGAVADHYASENVFADFKARKAKNTLAAHKFDLAVFAEYLDAAAGVVSTLPAAQQRAVWLTEGKRYQTTPSAWQGMTWGIVQGFLQWQLSQGAAIGSINRRLATVKVYAKLATKAGAIDPQAHALIRLVVGFAGKESKHVDEKRAVKRVGNKKAECTVISDAQAAALKSQPDTPQGRRDAVIMTMLLDLGLRVGELAALQVSDINLKAGKLRFYRPKVGIEQTHKLSADCLVALRNWFDSGDCAPFGPLLRGSRKGGHLTAAGMSETSISERVRALGAELEIDCLSAHDCRHYWATKWAASGIDVFRLQEAGGWASLEMPRRYVKRSEIANKGMA